MSTNDKLEVAVIGTGNISSAHLRELAEFKDVEITALCDVDEKAARAKSEMYGGEVFTDHEAMLDAVTPDAVFVFTPQTVREEPLAACARRKVPVLCEKPPARDMETACRITKIINDAEIINSIGFLFRYMKIVERAKKLVDRRKIVAVRLLYICPMMYPDNRAKDFFYRKEESGGLILDQSVHLLDLARFILDDEIDEVHAMGANIMQPKTSEITSEETVIMNMRSAGGVPVSYLHTWAHRGWGGVAQIFAEDMVLDLDLFNKGLTGVFDGMTVAYAPKDAAMGMDTEDRVFLDAVRTGDASGIRSTYEDSVKTLALALAVNRSVETGTVQKVTV